MPGWTRHATWVAGIRRGVASDLVSLHAALDLLLLLAISVTDSHLAALTLLFDKHVVKAASIVDSYGVTSHEGKESGRIVYQVRSKDGDPYTVFPGHYCSCYSFFYDVVSRAEGVCCKHQLAVFLSNALGRTRKSKVPDRVVAEILEAC